MRIGILGSKEVGAALGDAFINIGHEVMMGAREANNERAVAWAGKHPARASHGTLADAAAFGEIIVLATLGVADESVIAAAKAENFAGKIVIDATNPLDFSGGMPPKLAWSGNDSGGERVQRFLPDARVVKAFNTVGNLHMFRPDFPDGPPDMFIAGNDEGAKQQVSEILKQFGWGVVDCGGIESSRYLEAMCIVWVIAGARSGNWNQAFKLLKK
jgi:predicted dinucleotide-binding enzyme